jgi:hypothetical protein
MNGDGTCNQELTAQANETGGIPAGPVMNFTPIPPSIEQVIADRPRRNVPYGHKSPTLAMALLCGIALSGGARLPISAPGLERYRKPGKPRPPHSRGPVKGSCGRCGKKRRNCAC